MIYSSCSSHKGQITLDWYERLFCHSVHRSNVLFKMKANLVHEKVNLTVFLVFFLILIAH